MSSKFQSSQSTVNFWRIKNVFQKKPCEKLKKSSPSCGERPRLATPNTWSASPSASPPRRSDLRPSSSASRPRRRALDAGQVARTTFNKDYPLAPDKPVCSAAAPALDAEAQLAPSLRKYKQINALFGAIERAHCAPRPAWTLRLLELCAGQSHLSLLIACGKSAGASRCTLSQSIGAGAAARRSAPPWPRRQCGVPRAIGLGPWVDDTRASFGGRGRRHERCRTRARLRPAACRRLAAAAARARPSAAVFACTRAHGDRPRCAGIASEAALLAVAPCC